MKIGDKICGRFNNNIRTYINDIVGDMIYIVHPLYKNKKNKDIIVSFKKSTFISLYLTEKEIRKQKLEKLNELHLQK